MVTILAKRLAQLCPVVPHVCSAVGGPLVKLAELILVVVPPTSRMRYFLFPCTKEWSLLVLLNRRPFHLLLEADKVVSGEILVEHGDGNAVVALELFRHVCDVLVHGFVRVILQSSILLSEPS